MKELDAEHVDERRRSRMLQSICGTGAVVASAAHLIRLEFGTTPSALTSFAAATIVSSFVIAFVMLRNGALVPRAAMLPIAGLLVGIPCLGFANGGIHAPIVATVPTIPIVTGLFLGFRKAVAVAAILALEMVCLAALGGMGLLPHVTIAPLARAAMVVAFMLVNMVIITVYEIERRSVESRLREVAAELYQSSIVDPLTLVFNRRHFEHRLREELAYAHRHETRVGVLLVDADHFKQVNDTHGHDAGDFVLKSLASILNDTLRAEDVLARFGGEEFVVLLRDVSAEQLWSAGDRIRKAILDHPFEYGGVSIPVTISVGGASKLGKDTTSEALVALADTRLYAAKHAGRNCVIADDVFNVRRASRFPVRISRNPEAPMTSEQALAS